MGAVSAALQSLAEWVEGALGLEAELQWKLYVSIGSFLALLLLRLLLLVLVRRRTSDPRVHYRWKKASLYFSFFVLALVLWRVWFQGLGPAATYFGLLSAGLAIALQTPLVNLAGWAFILWRRPFEVGDRIEIAGRSGDVIDLRIFQFTLLEIGNWVDADQSTGRIIHVPNGTVFSDSLASYTKGFSYIWHEIPVLVTFESDWRLGKRVLQEIAVRHAAGFADGARHEIARAARRFPIVYSKVEPIVYTSVKDSGVMLTLRFLCDPRRRRGINEAVWEDILEAFAGTEALEFAYPTQRFFRLGEDGSGAE